MARIIAISYKGDQPKIGLTMRQPGLGKLEWLSDDKRKAKNKAGSEEKKGSKGVKKK